MREAEDIRAGRRGKIVIPCTYLEHSFDNPTRNYFDRPKEIMPGIIKIDKLYMDANTGDVFSEVTNIICLRSYDEYNFDVDVIDTATRKVICSHIGVNQMEVWDNGWSIIDTKEMLPDGEHWRMGTSLLIHKDNIIPLGTADVKEWMGDYVKDDKNIPFISNNRIITYIYKGGGGGTLIPENLECINIRDYNGSIIKTINNPDIFITRPYKYGKAIGFTMIGDTPENLAYLDANGNEYVIPYSVKHIKLTDLYECFFASEDTIVVKNGHKNVLINTKGKTLLDKEGWIEQLSEGYLKYYDYKSGKYGLADGKGDTILFPRYDNVDILQ